MKQVLCAGGIVVLLIVGSLESCTLRETTDWNDLIPGPNGNSGGGGSGQEDAGTGDGGITDGGPCANNVKDGDESDVDCGGSCPKKCLQGQVCMEDKDCLIDILNPFLSLFCRFGTCCPLSCPACYACGVPGFIGECTMLPDGIADDSCKSNQACRNGACFSGTMNGQQCSVPDDCVSGQCANGICKQAPGTACADDSVCASGQCVNNICQQIP